MMMDKYILRGHKPVLCNDLMEWARWFEDSKRRVAYDKFNGGYVSTVFLGCDHNWGQCPPLLFETMVFGGKNNEHQERYSTWDEAEAGHKRVLALCESQWSLKEV